MSKLGKFAAACAAVLCAFSGFGALPAPYQAVEYIESHGGEGIDTGFSPAKAGGTAMDIEFMLMGNYNNTAITSCGYYDFSRYLCILQNSKVKFGTGTEVANYFNDMRYRFVVASNGAYQMTTNGAPYKSGSVSTVNNSYSTNLQLFNCGNSYKAYMRLYGASFSDANGPIRTFVPCYSNGVNGVKVGGLYDRVTETFYASNRGGAFTWGANRLLEDDLLVRGDPVNCGTPSIAYGVHSGYAADEPVTISFPHVGMNAEGTINGTCTGYEVLTNGLVYASGTFDESTGETCSFTFDFPDCDHGAEVVLKWTAQCKVSATCDTAKGTVSKDYEWHTPGETFTVEVTEEKSGYVFYRWMGSDGKEYGRDKTLTITVADQLTLTAEFGALVELSPSGGDDTDAIKNAVAAAGGGGTVRLGTGTFKISSTVVVDNDITIRGATGNRDDVIVDAQNKCRAFWLKDMPGTLKDLTVTHGYQGSYTGKGGGVYMEGGLVQNCRFTACKTCQEGFGGAIYMTAGTVEDTLVDANVTYNGAFYGTVYIDGSTAVFRNSQFVNNGPISTSGNGMNTLGISLKNGLVENCLIANNKIGSQSGTASHGCPALSISGGTVKGCSIVGNGGSANTAAGYTFAAVNKAGGSIVDTLIFDNWDGAGHRADVRGTLSGFSNCCLPSLEGVSGENLIAAADALWFVEDDNFGYYPGSPCIEPQIGIPGSYDPGEAMCAFTHPEVMVGLDPYKATFQAYADGTALPANYRYRWTFTDPSAAAPIIETVDSAAYAKTLAAGAYDVMLEIVDQDGKPCASFEKKALVTVGSSEYHPADVDELKAAVAAQADGMIIYLAADTTYAVSETIVLNKNVRIVGADRDTTIVDGQGKCRVFKIEGETAPNAVIANLTIRRGSGGGNDGGNGSTLANNPGGGGALLYKGGMLTNCVVEACTGASCTGANGVHVVGGKVVDTIIRNLSQSSNIIWGQALIASGGALVDHCVVSNCSNKSLTSGVVSAAVEAYGEGTELRNCLITDCRYGCNNGSSDSHGMAIYFRSGTPKAVNCTIVGNTMDSEKGAAVVGSGTLENCVVVDNFKNCSKTKAESNLASGPSATYSLTRPLRSGTGNVTADTVFKEGSFELAYGSPAIGTGDVKGWMTGAKDLNGIDRLRDGKVDMGAFTYVPPALACSISCAAEKKVLDAIDVTITSSADGKTEGLVYSWRVNGVEAGTDASFNLATAVPGSYSVVLYVENGNGDTATSEPIFFVVVPSTIYVDVTSTEPVSPYGDPDHAAVAIQDALDVAMAGCTVLVKPGTYESSKAIYVNAPITIRSSSGRDDTIVWVRADVVGFDLTESSGGATLAGITVTNGYPNVIVRTGSTVSGCRFAGGRCTATLTGSTIGPNAIIVNGTARDCEFVNTYPNPTYTSQIYMGSVHVSGDNALVERCLIANNTERGIREDWNPCTPGLHLASGKVRNCLFRGNKTVGASLRSGSTANHAHSAAAVVMGGIFENCTIVGNTVHVSPYDGRWGQAIHCDANGTVRNCIIWDNVSENGDVANWGGTEAKYTYCCTLPELADEHSKSSDPMFKKGNVWEGDITGLSPCVNAGYYSASWMSEATDYFGRPFAHGAKKNKVPIGCASPAAGGFSLIVR